MIYLMLFCFSFSAFAQETKNETIISKPSVGAFCELNKVFLEKLFIEQKKNNERIFVISNSGDKEKLNIRQFRLNSARTFLIRMMKFAEDNIVFAEDDARSEAGALRFYLGSRLFLVIEQPFNKISCFTCCENFIPKKTKTRKN